MAKQRDDDLFKDTTMTFGEHLDELRVCLIRAVIGLFLGTLIGLYTGDYFVRFISAPLTAALKEYYKTQAENDYQTWATDRLGKGLPVPYTLQEVKDIAAGDEDNPELIYEVKLLHTGTIGMPGAPGSVSPAPPSAAARPADPATNAEPTPPAAAATPGKEESKPTPPAVDPSKSLVSKTAPGEVALDDKAATEKTAAAPSAYNRVNLMPVLLWAPLDNDHRVNPQGLGPAEAFSVWLKASLVVGAVLSSPWVFLQIWTFVASGLYPHERRYVYVFLPFSLGLFFLGVSVAFIFVFEPVLNFLLEFNRSMGINPDPRITDWLSFVLLLPLGFGVSFQLPLVMLFLNRIGVFDARAYVEKWRIAVLVIFVLSAVLTPADPYSMLLMAVPLTFLYFGGILLCHYLPRKA